MYSNESKENLPTKHQSYNVNQMPQADALKGSSVLHNSEKKKKTQKDHLDLICEYTI